MRAGLTGVLSRAALAVCGKPVRQCSKAPADRRGAQRGEATRSTVRCRQICRLATQPLD